MEPRLSLVTLGVADVARARSFYQATGFVVSTPGSQSVTFFPTGGVVLALYGRGSLADGAMVADSAPVFPLDGEGCVQLPPTPSAT